MNDLSVVGRVARCYPEKDDWDGAVARLVRACRPFGKPGVEDAPVRRSKIVL